MQAWEGLRSQPTQQTGQLLCLLAGSLAQLPRPGEEQGGIHSRKKGKLLTSLMTCRQAPHGEIKSSCKLLRKQRIKHGSVSSEARGQLLKFRPQVLPASRLSQIPPGSSWFTGVLRPRGWEEAHRAFRTCKRQGHVQDHYFHQWVQ